MHNRLGRYFMANDGKGKGRVRKSNLKLNLVFSSAVNFCCGRENLA